MSEVTADLERPTHEGPVPCARTSWETDASTFQCHQARTPAVHQRKFSRCHNACILQTSKHASQGSVRLAFVKGPVLRSCRCVAAASEASAPARLVEARKWPQPLGQSNLIQATSDVASRLEERSLRKQLWRQPLTARQSPAWEFRKPMVRLPSVEDQALPDVSLRITKGPCLPNVPHSRGLNRSRASKASLPSNRSVCSRRTNGEAALSPSKECT